MTGLRFQTVALPEPPDLLAEAGADGLLFRDEHGDGLAARGSALRLDLAAGLSDAEELKRLTSALSSIPGTDEVNRPGTGPVGIGALPFDPARPGHLVVPHVLYGRAGNQGWMTTVRGGGEAGTAGSEGPPAGQISAASPDEFRLTPSLSHADWKATVAEAVNAIERGDLEKVVLARRIAIEANRPFVIPEVLERLVALYPACMVYLVEGFLGASPELLVRRTGGDVECRPLAGTVARSGDAHGDELLVARLMETRKLRHEHRIVIDQMAAVLRPLCSVLDVPDTPSVLGLRNVSHLATHITGRLAGDPAAAPSALELAAAIHPTPAVGGSPTDAAITYLQRAEGFDRGCYAGPVGWVDGRGDGCFAVGIRCADVDGNRAAIYAGNGIVAGSDPVEELAETQLKLQALLAALVRP